MTTALSIFAEFGFLQVAQVAPADFAAVLSALRSAGQTRVALNVSPRSEAEVDALHEQIARMKAQGEPIAVLWLEAPVDTLVERYLAADKPHPLERHGLHAAVKEECALVSPLKSLKDYAIDTSTTTRVEMRFKLARVLGIPLDARQPMTLYVTSFAFKRGIPADADLVLDVRFLKNPFYIESLRPQTGRDAGVRDYIFSFEAAGRFLKQWTELLDLMLPLYREEGRTRLTVAFGCTGGQHRSVCFAESVGAYLKERYDDCQVLITHREQAHWPAASTHGNGKSDTQQCLMAPPLTVGERS